MPQSPPQPGAHHWEQSHTWHGTGCCSSGGGIPPKETTFEGHSWQHLCGLCKEECKGEQQRVPPPWAAGRDQTPPEKLPFFSAARSQIHPGASAPLLLFIKHRVAPLGFNLPITPELKARPPACLAPTQQRLCLQFINYYHFS